MPSHEAVAWVREAIATLPDPQTILKIDPVSLDGPSLLKAAILIKALLRDAVVRTATLPPDPNWGMLRRQADDVVRLDLVTVSAVAEWLDAIDDRPTVYAFLLCRHAGIALLGEYHRRLDADPVLKAYADLDTEAAESRPRLSQALKLRSTGRLPTDAADDEAVAHLTIVELVAQAGQVLREAESGKNYNSWMQQSPFRRLRPAMPAWDRHSGALFNREMAEALNEDILAVELPDAQAAATNAVESPRRRDRRRRLILRLRQGDLEPPDAPDQLAETVRQEQAAAGSRALDALEKKYGRRLWRAYWATVQDGIADAEAARRSRLELRTFQRRKAEIRKDLKNLASA